MVDQKMVDQQAKTLLSLEPTSFKITFSNFSPSINKYILDEWQTSGGSDFRLFDGSELRTYLLMRW